MVSVLPVPIPVVSVTVPSAGIIVESESEVAPEFLFELHAAIVKTKQAESRVNLNADFFITLVFNK
jgi:hypothetical protein